MLDTSPPFRALYDGDQTEFHTTAGWAALELEFWRLRFVPGVRYEYYSLSKDEGVGPRMMAELNFEETGTSLMAGAGRHFNVPTDQSMISNRAGNPYLLMEASDHTALGLEQSLGKAWLLKIEFFRNTFTNLIVEDAYIVVPLSPRTDGRDLVENHEQIQQDPYENRYIGYSNDGTGHSEGFEVMLKKKREPSHNGWFGWLSYTYSITKRNNHQPRLNDDDVSRFNIRKANNRVLGYYEQDRLHAYVFENGELDIYYDNDREEFYDLDRTHQISLVWNYKFNPRWQLGGRFTYLTNTPYTPIEGQKEAPVDIGGRPTYLPVYSDRYNSNRLHPYHQFDLRLDHFENYNWGYANYFIELINVYGRRNPTQENWDALYPYMRGSNPETQYEATVMEVPVGGTRKILIPLINMGLEIKF